jgi:hypothetical protein
MLMIKKHPSSVINVAFDFTRQLQSGETLTGASTLTVTPAGQLAVSGPTTAGNVINVNAAAGTSGVIYVVGCQSPTSQGRSLVAQQGISVNDPGNYP